MLPYGRDGSVSSVTGDQGRIPKPLEFAPPEWVGWFNVRPLLRVNRLPLTRSAGRCARAMVRANAFCLK